jgi:hypothetical protein
MATYERQGRCLIQYVEVLMDIVFIGAIVLFLALSWGMANGCARLGART